jgi:hypothetical protein
MSFHPIHTIKESDFLPIEVRIIHSTNTGHIYVRPKDNLHPFSEEQEEDILDICYSKNIGTVRNRVTSNFRVKETKPGYGFRLFQA